MNTTIKLYRKNWFSTSSVSAIGWAEYNGKCYTGDNFAQLIDTETRDENFTLTDAEQLGKKLNGSYAVIIRKKERIYLMADRTRSYPLLYTTVNGITYITDHLLNAIREFKLDPEPDVKKAEIFLLAGFTLENSTVYRDVYALQAAEIAEISEKGVHTCRYFIYKLNTDRHQDLSVQTEIEKQNTIFTRVFKRTLESAPHIHNWILPLSGGHDSRMVINQLHKLGVRNLICFSYGTTDNRQSQLSEEVARKLGYLWYFIEYTPEKWRKLRESQDFNNYFDFAFNGVSDPHIQDLLAVAELKRQGIAGEGDIFIPGHTFDFLTGAYCQNGICGLYSEKDIYKYLAIYFNQWEYKKRSHTVFKELATMINRAPVPRNGFSEYFHWQERHAKFIQNSIRVYEYFGFDWRTPLWDLELVEYWQHIHLDHKMYRNFLYLCEKNGLYQEPLSSIPFDTEIHPAKNLKEKIKASIPSSLKRLLRYTLKKETPHSDDALHTIYAGGSPMYGDLHPYDNLPKSLQRYLKPYLKRPLHWFPDNDNNTLYAIRNLFK